MFESNESEHLKASVVPSNLRKQVLEDRTCGVGKNLIMQILGLGEDLHIFSERNDSLLIHFEHQRKSFDSTNWAL